MELVKKYMNHVLGKRTRGLTEGQKVFVENNTKWKMLLTDRGYGKTTVAVREAMLAVQESPGSRILIVSPAETMSVYKRNMIADKASMLGTKLVGIGKDRIVFKNTSVIEFVSGLQVRNNALRGRRYDLTIVDDAESLGDEALTEVKVCTTHGRLVLTATRMNEHTKDMLDVGMDYVLDYSTQDEAYAF